MRPRGRRDSRSDRELCQAALATPESEGAKLAASELLGRYRRRVYAWCYQYFRHPEAAADVAQDVLIAAYRGLASFKGTAQFGSWLFAITRNQCISAARRTSVRTAVEADPEVDEVASTGPAAAPDRGLAEKDFWELVREHLDPAEQEAVWLRYHEGMPLEMITDLLELSERSGARAVLQRARRKLRQIPRLRWDHV